MFINTIFRGGGNFSCYSGDTCASYTGDDSYFESYGVENPPTTADPVENPTTTADPPVPALTWKSITYAELCVEDGSWGPTDPPHVKNVVECQAAAEKKNDMFINTIFRGGGNFSCYSGDTCASYTGDDSYFES